MPNTSMTDETEQPSSYFEALTEKANRDISWPAFFIPDTEVSAEQDEATVGVYIVNNPGIAGSWDSESKQSEENGAVLALTFKLPKEVRSGESFDIRCSFREGDVYDSSLNNVSVGTNTGKIVIK